MFIEYMVVVNVKIKNKIKINKIDLMLQHSFYKHMITYVC